MDKTDIIPLIVVGLVVGYAIGFNMAWSKFEREVVKAGFAEYDSVTGKWKYKVQK